MVGHLVVVVGEDGEPLKTDSGDLKIIGRAGRSQRGEFASAYTCSRVLRRESLDTLLESAGDGLVLSDRFTPMCASEAGEVVVLDDVMGAYRVHPSGVFSGATATFRAKEQLRSASIMLRRARSSRQAVHTYWWASVWKATKTSLRQRDLNLLRFVWQQVRVCRLGIGTSGWQG